MLDPLEGLADRCEKIQSQTRARTDSRESIGLSGAARVGTGGQAKAIGTFQSYVGYGLSSVRTKRRKRTVATVVSLAKFLPSLEAKKSDSETVVVN
jgi:hypothetical protein